LLPRAGSDALLEARVKLIGLVEQRMDATLERIFRLLGLRYPPEDVIPVYQGIRHVNPTVRMNSVEFLDNLLEPTLKRTLIPIAESAAFENISNSTLDAMRIKIPSERECLALLLQGKDPKLKLAVLNVIKNLGDITYVDLVRPYLDSTDVRLKEEAEQILHRLR
jgi:AAA family ATP:ADP antiporter